MTLAFFFTVKKLAMKNPTTHCISKLALSLLPGEGRTSYIPRVALEKCVLQWNYHEQHCNGVIDENCFCPQKTFD